MLPIFKRNIFTYISVSSPTIPSLYQRREKYRPN